MNDTHQTQTTKPMTGEQKTKTERIEIRAASYRQMVTSIINAETFSQVALEQDLKCDLSAEQRITLLREALQRVNETARKGDAATRSDWKPPPGDAEASR